MVRLMKHATDVIVTIYKYRKQLKVCSNRQRLPLYVKVSSFQVVWSLHPLYIVGYLYD